MQSTVIMIGINRFTLMSFPKSIAKPAETVYLEIVFLALSALYWKLVDERPLSPFTFLLSYVQ